MDQIVGIGVAIVVLVVCFGGALWFQRRKNESRKARELRDPNRRPHWAMIVGYMGKADPTRLSLQEARHILDDNWSCGDLQKLTAKINLYRKGEINDAFDVARALWLGELGLAAKWLMPQDVANWSDEGRERLRRAYPSWQAYGAALMQGRERWYVEVAREPGMPEAQRARGQDALAFAERIWKTTPW